jgi:hypothetical protein
MTSTKIFLLASSLGLIEVLAGTPSASSQTVPNVEAPSQLPIESPVLNPVEASKPESSTPAIAAPETAQPEWSTALTQKQAAIKIISPTSEATLDLPAATIVVQFPVGSSVKLRVNGTEIDPSLVGRTETNTTQQLVTQSWYGVPLREGENRLEAVSASSSAAINVQVRGGIAQLKLETLESRIPADGRSTATVQGKLLDQQGNRSNRDAVVTLISNEGEWVGADADPDQPGFQVQAKQGELTAKLRSTLNAKTVNVQAVTGNLEAFTQVQFTTALRPSLTTGVIDVRLGERGTNFHGSLRDFLPPDGNYSTQFDVKGAVFSTGKIGNWLFTGAFNSDRALNQSCDGNRLFRETQFCDQNYPVYGDSSKVDVLAPSTDSVFVRFEKTSAVRNASADYFMWGDYNTEEFASRSQQFTATTRQLHGFKANYNIGNLQITGLYGDNVEGFQRDTIAPDGTSGYYFLSRRLLIPGSENIFVELEELNRPGTVIERVALNRGPDYEIDYDRGSILFRRPFLQTDTDSSGRILVRRIVATYQYDNKGSNNSIYAGRVRYHFSRDLNRETWIGATYFQENLGARQFKLYGADALIALGNKANLIAEYAHSDYDSDFLGAIAGSAYRFEAQGEITPGIQGRAYYQSADAGFTNNATVSFVPGQIRYGAQLTGKVTGSTSIRAQYDHEDNFGVAPQSFNTLEELLTPRSEALPGRKVDNSLTTISAGIQQRFGASNLEVDWVHRDRADRLLNGNLNGSSDQLRSRFTMPLAKNLTFLALNETTLTSQTDPVYSDRTLLGLNWNLYPGVDFRLAQNFFTRGQYAGQSFTTVDITGAYKLGRDTTLTGRYSVLGGANEMTTQGAVGLNHVWRVSPGLRLNASYEHIFGSASIQTAAGNQFAQPYAPGQSASALGLQGGDSYSIGFEYTDSPAFQASARYEHRTSSTGQNTVISASALGKLSPSLTGLLRYQQSNSANQAIVGLDDTKTLKFGLAYRDPNNDKFNALLRYEYRKNPATIPDTVLLGSGTGSADHLFALEAIYAPSWRWEFYGKYALRNSQSFLASDLVGTSTTSLAQVRATYRLDDSWDLTGEARWIVQPASDYRETGLMLEAGYYLTPNLRLAAGYSFGRVSDRDFNGSRSNGGLYFGLTIKVNELFDGFGLQKAPSPTKSGDQISSTKNVK